MKITSVLVTGAASGIGLKCAKGLIEGGNHVTALDVNKENLIAQYPAPIDRVLLVAGDVSEQSDCRNAVVKSIEVFGRIDALIHFAGIHSTSKLEELTVKEFTRVLNVNLIGSFLMAQAVAKPMIEQGGGSILLTASAIFNIGGIGGDNGQGGPAYASSKGGVVALMRSLARSLGPYGIRVNAINPGSIDTPMTKKYTNSTRQKVRNRTLLGRIGQPEDISDVARFLITDAARYITGEIVNVNGGAVMA
jgi:3-oxoacyl-[acyl-carrier protein] reductase